MSPLDLAAGALVAAALFAAGWFARVRYDRQLDRLAALLEPRAAELDGPPPPLPFCRACEREGVIGTHPSTVSDPCIFCPRNEVSL